MSQKKKTSSAAFPSIMVGAPKSKGEQLVEQTMVFKAYKINKRNELKQLRKEASTDFRAKNKGWLRVLDILAILCILMNFGALFITGMLVVRADPDKGFVEANPTQCDWNGWNCHQDAAQIFWPIIRQLFLWGIIAGGYIYTRNNVFKINDLWILTLFLILYTVVIGADFINDLGLYLGKIIWGV